MEQLLIALALWCGNGDPFEVQQCRAFIYQCKVDLAPYKWGTKAEFECWKNAKMPSAKKK